MSLPRAPNVAPLRALWSLLDGIWGLLKGSWVVLVLGAYLFRGSSAKQDFVGCRSSGALVSRVPPPIAAPIRKQSA